MDWYHTKTLKGGPLDESQIVWMDVWDRRNMFDDFGFIFANSLAQTKFRIYLSNFTTHSDSVDRQN